MIRYHAVHAAAGRGEVPELRRGRIRRSGLVLALLLAGGLVAGSGCGLGGYTHYTYYPGNKIRTRCSFDMNGKPTGTWILYKENGSVLAEGTYRNGLPWNGTFFEEYDLHDPPALTTYREGRIVASPSP